MIRVVDLEFGGVVDGKFEDFPICWVENRMRSSGLYFFKKWEPDEPPIRFTISKNNEDIYVISWRAVVE